MPGLKRSVVGSLLVTAALRANVGLMERAAMDRTERQ